MIFGQTHLMFLEHLFTLGTEMLVAAILGSSSQHVDPGAGKEILEFSP